MHGPAPRPDDLQHACLGGIGPRDLLASVTQAADSMIRSSEPAVVFEDLVQRSAPLVCEAARALVYGAGAKLHASAWPTEEIQQPDRPGTVVTEVTVPASGDHEGYHGIVSLRFASADPLHDFAARLLVDRAVANVERARLAETATRHKEEAANLAIALNTNRDIGVAVGIVMANNALDRDEAFALLSRASQASNRKVHDIALEVARTN